MEGHHLTRKRHRTLLPYIYAANILLSFHYFLIVYINSSSLERFFNENHVGFLFIAGAIMGLILLLTAPKIITKVGVYRYLFTVIALECIAVLGLADATSAIATGFYFLLHNCLVPMILFCLDILLEGETVLEKNTGKIRSIFLTITNCILVISPLITGFILRYYSFSSLYFFSALFCIPLLLIVRTKLGGVGAKSLRKTHMLTSIQFATQNKDLRNILAAQFILQFFYAWMVIYLPIYLIKEIGFGWQELGFLFTIMLLPFALFEIPVGWLADNKFGEKEFMIFGFIVMALASSVVAILNTPVFLFWAILLFISRVGASFAEVTSESYFFKHVTGSDSDLISIFRTTRPLAYITAPLIATLTLFFIPIGASFLILGSITFLGSVAAFHITDTM